MLWKQLRRWCCRALAAASPVGDDHGSTRAKKRRCSGVPWRPRGSGVVTPVAPVLSLAPGASLCHGHNRKRERERRNKDVWAKAHTSSFRRGKGCVAWSRSCARWAARLLVCSREKQGPGRSSAECPLLRNTFSLSHGAGRWSLPINGWPLWLFCKPAPWARPEPGLRAEAQTTAFPPRAGAASPARSGQKGPGRACGRGRHVSSGCVAASAAQEEKGLFGCGSGGKVF